LSVARRAAWTAAALVSLIGVPFGAEIYQWTDAEGRVHFTEHLDRVPPAQREQAMKSKRSEGEPGGVQTYSSSPPAAAAAPGAARASRLTRELRIPFKRVGSLMQVNVRLNDRITAPFLIDTGASGIALPSSVADRLGLRVGRDTPHVDVHTANGRVSRPVVRLDSVELDGARVEGLEATLNPTMEIGLLGGTFFNNFVYRVDAAAGVIALSPNDQMRGGLAAEAWRERFRALRDPLARLEAHLATMEEDLANTNPFERKEREKLEQRRTELRARLEALDEQANKAGVPHTWRQ
jgi:clan AA aspartic protease (TIGR02281 family)